MIAGKKNEGVSGGLVAEDEGEEAAGWGDDDDGGDEFKDAEDDDGEVGWEACNEPQGFLWPSHC